MNPAPSSHPSPPVGEKVSAGRMRRFRGSRREISIRGILTPTLSPLGRGEGARTLSRCAGGDFFLKSGLKAGEFANINAVDLDGDEVAQGVGGVIATSPLLVDVGLQDIAGVVGIVLQIRQAGDEAGAARVDEQRGRDAGVGIAEALGDGGPAGHAIHIGGLQGQAELTVLAGDGVAAAFAAEGVGAGDKFGEHAPLLPLVPEGLAFGAGIGKAGQEMIAEVIPGTKNLVPAEHGLDGLGMAGGNPKALDVLIQDVDGAGIIAAAEENDGGMGEAVIHGGEPFGAIRRLEIRAEDMEAGREIPEILAGGKVPAPLIPRVMLPAGEAGEVGLVTGIDKGIVVHAGGDEAGGFGQDELAFAKGPGAGGGIEDLLALHGSLGPGGLIRATG